MSGSPPDKGSLPDSLPDKGPAARTAALARDLKPRIVSGVLLAALALALVWAGPMPFAALVITIAVAMCWEWGRVVRGPQLDPAFAAHAGAVVGAALLAALGFAALGLVLVLIGAVLVMLLQFGGHGRLSGLGVPYVGVPAVALLWFRSDEPYGFAAVLFILLVVCATDTFAYFGGRSIGGVRLWPRISPNKTWAGFISGIAAATVTGALFAVFLAGASPVRLAVTALVLGLVSQVGDLAESALKRGFGVKDASALMPGHGGFLDRMDGVVFAAAAAALAALVVDIQEPARALLSMR
ncbi:MAG: phosphatidate cytidylyltransferase [Hyphomicrobiaceae bacterium]|nr:phosphatidate cytidylyltransferase [Hyphomicrobiaceae bacterium]